MSISIYTTPTCGFCHQAKAYLEQRGVPFVEFDVSRDPQKAAEMVQVSGQRGVPVILLDGQVVLGYNGPMIAQLLAQRATRPPRLGVAIADSSRVAERKASRLPQGAYVGRVSPGSSAALAGMRPGDVIIQLAGQAVHSDQDVHRLSAGIRYDHDVDVLVWRNGQTIGMRVRL
jgi:glutaredoxin-like YruB-family protein